MSFHAFAVVALVALPAFAQTPSPAPAPATDRTAAPRAAPASAFADYRSWRDPDAVDWRAANATAGALGGHAGQVRGQPRPAADARTAPAPVPAPAVPGGKR